MVMISLELFLNSVIAFEAMLRFIYSGNHNTITSIQDLRVLFEVYYLADKVRTESIFKIIFFLYSMYSKFTVSVLVRLVLSGRAEDPGQFFYWGAAHVIQ